MQTLTLKMRVFIGPVEYLPGETITEEQAGSPEIFDHLCKAQGKLGEAPPVLPADIEISKSNDELTADTGEAQKAKQKADAERAIEESRRVAETAPETVPETRTNFDPAILDGMSLEDLNLLVVADGVTPPFDDKKEAICFLSHSFTPKV